MRSLGTILRLAGQSVRRRPLSSGLTALAVALGVALVTAVGVLRESTDRSFTEAARGYDVILGPPHGHALQAVLSTLFYVGEPTGTLSWRIYEEAQADPRVAAAVPYAMGDTYRGRRVIGTTPRIFEVLTDAGGRAVGDGMRGRVFREDALEAVVGSAVARSTGLSLGQSFRVTHGLAQGGHAHAEAWQVVGVLRPTGTPHDRAIYIPISTFHAIPGHDAPAPEGHEHGEDEDHGDHDHDADEHGEHDDGPRGDEAHGDGDAHEGDDAEEHGDEHAEGEHPRSLSAVGVRLKGPQLRLGYFHEFRTGRTDAQAILPTDQVRNLLTIVGDVNRGVRVIAWLVTVVAGIGILVGLYNTIQGRRREIAVLRALGARRSHVFLLILLESVLLCLLGGVLGLVLGRGGLAVLAPTLLETYGVRVDPLPGPEDLLVLLALVGLGLLAGLLPAWRGLVTPVAANLQREE